MIPWEIARHFSPRVRMLLEARLMCALTPGGQITLAAALAIECVLMPPGVATALLDFVEGFHAYRVEWDGPRGHG